MPQCGNVSAITPMHARTRRVHTRVLCHRPAVAAFHWSQFRHSRAHLRVNVLAVYSFILRARLPFIITFQRNFWHIRSKCSPAFPFPAMLKSHAPNGNINFSFKRGRSSHAFFVALFALPRCTTIPSIICFSVCRLRQAKMPGTARPSHLRIMKTQHNYPRKCRPNSTRLWTTNRWLGRGIIVRAHPPAPRATLPLHFVIKCYRHAATARFFNY